MDNRVFGRNLAAKREANGMSAEAFASAFGISLDEYCAIERGEREVTLDFAKRCADTFAVSLDELASEKYEPKFRMGALDGISDAEKASADAEREQNEVRLYNRGRTAMQIIIALEVISLVLSLFTNSLLATVFKIVMLVCLWKGRTWARTVYVILTGIGTLITFALVGQSFEAHWLLGTAALVSVAWGIAVCVLLLASKAVEEFLYEQSSHGGNGCAGIFRWGVPNFRW